MNNITDIFEKVNSVKTDLANRKKQVPGFFKEKVLVEKKKSPEDVVKETELLLAHKEYIEYIKFLNLN